MTKYLAAGDGIRELTGDELTLISGGFSLPWIPGPPPGYPWMPGFIRMVKGAENEIANAYKHPAVQVRPVSPY
jgi:hypothetical protein